MFGHKFRGLREEFDVYELNKRASFFMHDHSNKKFKNVVVSEKSSTIISCENSNDITEEFLESISDIVLPPSAKELPPFVPFSSNNSSTNVSEKEVVAKLGQKDTKCDLCGGLYTKKGLTKHRNKCLTQPEKHLSNQNK